MRFISFPFHGLEQLVEYNRNSPTVKRFLPIYANRCTRYPHYESPPAKTQSFPQHCRYTGKRCFQQFSGGSRSWVPTSSGDVFSAVRTHRYEKKSKRESPLMLAGDAKSSSSNEGAFGNPREIAREARSTDPGSTYPQHMKGYRWKTEAGNETTLKENGPYSRSMPAKRRKHAPKPATKGWKNIPLLIERFRRLWKTLKTWNSFENRCGKVRKRAFSNRFLLQTGKRLTRQLSMCIVFNTLLTRHFSVLYITTRMLFRWNARLTWCFPTPVAKPSHRLKKPVETCRNKLEFQQCRKPLHLRFSHLFEFSFQFSTIFE